RALDSRDRLTPRAVQELERADPERRVRLDVECWHPGDNTIAGTWLQEVRNGTLDAGGEVTDTYVNHRAGIILARIYLRAREVWDLATLDQIARIDLLPDPRFSWEELAYMTVDRLPAFDPPAVDAPIVGVIDSGVLPGHPLVRDCLVRAVTLT